MAGSERIPWQAGFLYPESQEVDIAGHHLRLTNNPFRRLRPVLERAGDVVTFEEIAKATGEDEELVRRDAYKHIHPFLTEVEAGPSRWWLRPIPSVGLQLLEVPDVKHKNFIGTGNNLRLHPPTQNGRNYAKLNLENYLTLAAEAEQFSDPHVQVTERRGKAINGALRTIGSSFAVGMSTAPIENARSRMQKRFGPTALAQFDFARTAGMSIEAAEGMTWIALGLLPNHVSKVMNRRDMQLLNRYPAAYRHLGVDQALNRADRLTVALVEGWRQKCALPPPVHDDDDTLPLLAPNEFDVLASFMVRPVVADVAKDLGLSADSVWRYLSGLQESFNVTNGLQLMLKAAETDAFAPFHKDPLLQALRGFSDSAYRHFQFARSVKGASRRTAIGIALMAEGILPTHAPHILDRGDDALRRCYVEAYTALGALQFPSRNRPAIALVRSWREGWSRPPTPDPDADPPLLTESQRQTLEMFVVIPASMYVARRLNISEHHANARIAELLHVFDARSHPELLINAVRTNVFRPLNFKQAIVEAQPSKPVATILRAADVDRFRTTDLNPLDLLTLQDAANGRAVKDGRPTESAEKTRRNRLFQKTQLPLSTLVTLALYYKRIRAPIATSRASPPDALRDRHFECASGIARGLKQTEIARELELDWETVRSHIRNGVRITHAKNATHFAAMCQAWGLLDVREEVEEPTLSCQADGAGGRRRRLHTPEDLAESEIPEVANDLACNRPQRTDTGLELSLTVHTNG